MIDLVSVVNVVEREQCRSAGDIRSLMRRLQESINGAPAHHSHHTNTNTRSEHTNNTITTQHSSVLLKGFYSEVTVSHVLDGSLSFRSVLGDDGSGSLMLCYFPFLQRLHKNRWHRIQFHTPLVLLITLPNSDEWLFKGHGSAARARSCVCAGDSSVAG